MGRIEPRAPALSRLSRTNSRPNTITTKLARQWLPKSHPWARQMDDTRIWIRKTTEVNKRAGMVVTVAMLVGTASTVQQRTSQFKVHDSALARAKGQTLPIS